jgi:hypothetical protein
MTLKKLLIIIPKIQYGSCLNNAFKKSILFFPIFFILFIYQDFWIQALLLTLEQLQDLTDKILEKSHATS